MRERGILPIAFLTALLAVCALTPSRGTGTSSAGREDGWACTLSGAQALPPNSSLATGTCDVSLRGDRIHVKLSWSGVSGPVVQVELHGPASADEEGPVLWGFTPGDRRTETSSPIEAEFEINHNQSDLLRDGRVYVDVRTAVFPAGEIRGQLLRRAGD
jgi:hypothetical protein